MRDGDGVHALAHVVAAPVFAIEVDHAQGGVLIHHVPFVEIGGKGSDDGIAHEGLRRVLPGGAQQERLVFRVVPVGEQAGAEAVIAILAARDHLEGLLLLGAAVLPVQLDAAALGDDGAAIQREDFHVRVALPVHPEIRALPEAAVGIGAGGVGPHGVDALFVAEQVVRIGDERNDLQRVVQII